MSEKKKHSEYVDRLLDNLGLYNQQDDALTPFSEGSSYEQESLRELFEKKKSKLKLPQKSILIELDIEYRALNGMLDGTQKMVDLLALSRLANFLEIPIEKAAVLLLKRIKNNFDTDVDVLNRREFMLKNFDLSALKKCGFIETTNDFENIEEVITKYFGLKSIYDFGKSIINIAYSSGKPTPKNNMMRNFWGESAAGKIKALNNPYEYNRQALIEYIPTIRWHTTDVRKGLYQVIRELFKLGITAIYEPYLTTIYVRGATIPVNNKPSIILTDYRNYYPSLWFSLMHEIYHVLFDWEEIRKGVPHFSSEIDRFDKKEVDADNFSREYLFSSDKMSAVSAHINNEKIVNRYANTFDIHPSIIYSFYCWEKINSGEDVFKYYQKYIPGVQEALINLDPDATRKITEYKKIPVQAKGKQLKKEIFNGL